MAQRYQLSSASLHLLFQSGQKRWLYFWPPVEDLVCMISFTAAFFVPSLCKMGATCHSSQQLSEQFSRFISGENNQRMKARYDFQSNVISSDWCCWSALLGINVVNRCSIMYCTSVLYPQSTEGQMQTTGLSSSVLYSRLCWLPSSCESYIWIPIEFPILLQMARTKLDLEFATLYSVAVLGPQRKLLFEDRTWTKLCTVDQSLVWAEQRQVRLNGLLNDRQSL